MTSYDAWKLRAPEDEPGYWHGRSPDEAPECDHCGMPRPNCLCSEPADIDDRAEAEAIEREAL